MSSFTNKDGAPLHAVNVHEGGAKRLYLSGVGDKKDALDIRSDKPTVAVARLTALFDGKKGMWTVDVSAKSKGNATLKAFSKKSEAATLVVNVIPKIVLPNQASEYGMMVRLLLIESRKPEEAGYDAAAVAKGMKYMRLVLINRLKTPADFGAKGAKNLFDIVKAPGQYKGFGSYPILGANQKSALDSLMARANDDSNPHQGDMANFILAAEQAASGSAISDPSREGLVGWRTAGSGSPGSNFVAFDKPIGGNQFYRRK